MKRIWILALALLLAGCGKGEAFETMNDQLEPAPVAATQPMQIILPEEAAVATWQSENGGKLFLCDGYTVTAHTSPSGDVNATLLDATGFTKEALQPMQTYHGEYTRYDCVWTAAGEGEEQVGRLALIDDGSTHYVLTAMAPASIAGQLTDQWQQLFDAFALGDPVSTGS